MFELSQKVWPALEQLRTLTSRNLPEPPGTSQNLLDLFIKLSRTKSSPPDFRPWPAMASGVAEISVRNVLELLQISNWKLAPFPTWNLQGPVQPMEYKNSLKILVALLAVFRKSSLVEFDLGVDKC